MENKKDNILSNPLKVLLAEDKAEIRALLLLYLARANAVCKAVTNGSQVLSALKQDNYDLILMDMEMPIMNGLTAVIKLRALGYKRPIFALTANSGQYAKEACLHAGCNGYICKPVNPKELNALVARFSLEKFNLEKSIELETNNNASIVDPYQHGVYFN